METLYYREKSWFKYVTRLNATGLVPGLTLTEVHVSKKDCMEMLRYSGPRSNNGYSLKPDCFFFQERLQWLYVRVHQVDRPTNNDFSLAFAQGLLHKFKTNEEIDWAELAYRTVNRYSKTKGVKSVHANWAWAYPCVTIDLGTGMPICRDFNFPNTLGSRPIWSCISTSPEVCNVETPPRRSTRSCLASDLPISSSYYTTTEGNNRLGRPEKPKRRRNFLGSYHSPHPNVASTSRTRPLSPPPITETCGTVQPQAEFMMVDTVGPSTLVPSKGPTPKLLWWLFSILEMISKRWVRNDSPDLRLTKSSLRRNSKPLKLNCLLRR